MKVVCYFRLMDSPNRISKIRTFHKELTRGWRKARFTLYGLCLRRLHVSLFFFNSLLHSFPISLFFSHR